MARIGVSGGIFGSTADRAEFMQSAPEYRQVECLQKHFDVGTFGPDETRGAIARYRPRCMVVNHLTKTAVRVATTRIPFIFVAHSGLFARPWLRRVSVRERLGLEFVARRAERVVGLSQEDAMTLRGVVGDPRKVVLLPNALDPERYRGEAREQASADVLFVGHLTPEKGFPVLLEAIRLLEERQGRPLSVRCISFHSDEERTAMLAHARRIRLNASLEFLPGMPLDELLDHLRAAKLYVSPSFAEAQSTVIEEALAVGTQVIASRVGSAPELLPPQALFSPGNSQELAIALELALTHPSSVEYMQHDDSV